MDLLVTHARDHTHMLHMVAIRAAPVEVLEVMMGSVVGVNKGLLSHKAFRVVRQPALLKVEVPPIIQGILIELLLLASIVGEGTLELVGKASQGVTSVVR